MDKIKIISLGSGQSNFLLQLYGEIKLRTDKFTFHVDNFKDLSKGEVDYNNLVFESYHKFEDHDFSRKVQFQTFIGLLFKRIFWIFLWFEFKRKKKRKHLFEFIENQVKFKACVDRALVPLHFDIYQFHFCIRQRLKLLHYLPKGSKIVCSFWGSDLYRNQKDYNIFYVRHALKKATSITIQTPEMAEDLYKLYGKDLKKKVKFAKFAIQRDIYKLIDIYRMDKNSLDKFKAELNIPNNNVIVTIGYNANKYFRHIEILNIIKHLDSEITKEVTLILPLTYSRDDNKYLEDLYERIKSMRLNIICINSFMTHEEIAKLRLITDIQIQLPTSDALSGSVTEVLYAGNTVLAGSWLPYGIYKRNNISILTIDYMSDLEEELIRLLKNWNRRKAIDHAYISSKIEDIFFPDTTTKAWIDLYTHLSKMN